MKGDLGKSFEKIKKEMYIPYRNALIEAPSSPTHPFRWNDASFSSLIEAKNAIDQSINSLQKSIKK